MPRPAKIKISLPISNPHANPQPMSKFQESKEKFYWYMNRAQRAVQKYNVFSANRSPNFDEFLIPVQIENTSLELILIERDQRFDEYVMQKNIPLAPLRYFLNPTKSVIVPNRYIILKNFNSTNPTVECRMHFGDAKRD